MKSIKITILDRQYPLRVEDDEEETMRRIARYVDDTFSQYRNQLSKQPDATVMVLAALSIAEELFEERRNSEKQQHEMMDDVNNSMESLLEKIRA